MIFPRQGSPSCPSSSATTSGHTGQADEKFVWFFQRFSLFCPKKIVRLFSLLLGPVSFRFRLQFIQACVIILEFKEVGQCYLTGENLVIVCHIRLGGAGSMFQFDTEPHAKLAEFDLLPVYPQAISDALRFLCGEFF